MFSNRREILLGDSRKAIYPDLRCGIGWLVRAGAMPADFLEFHADEIDVRLCNTFAVLHMATSAGKVVVSLSERELERLSLRIQMETARQAGRSNLPHIPSI